MKNTIRSFLLLVATLLSCACSNRQDAPTGELPAWLRPRRQVKIPPAALQIHYRPPHRLDALKDALTPIAGFAVALVWPHLEGLRSFSVWVFEPPAPTPETRARPDFVACLSGKITDWLYVGRLRTPEGAPVNFQKDRLWRVRIPWGPDPVHYLQDRGGRACLGSTEALTREALDWSAPAFPADGFLRVHGHAPSLFFLAERVGLVAAVKPWLPLPGVTASLARKLMGASEWLMEVSAMDEDGNANEKSSVKVLEKSADVHRWEYASTAAEDAREREANNRLFGGTMRVECRKVNGGVVMTGGAAWPEGEPAPLPDDNQHVVFSLLQSFNYVFPLADVYAGNWPRFLGYPSVPRDLWRLSVRFESPKKSMTIETTLPLGVFLRGLKEHPVFLKHLKFILFPEAPAEAKPTDL